MLLHASRQLAAWLIFDVSQNSLMNLDSFARFFVRFNGLCFAFWAIHSLFDFPYLYSNFSIAKEAGVSGSILSREFYVFIGKFAMEVLAAALLLARTDKVITFVLTGKWRLPAKPEEPSAKSG